MFLQSSAFIWWVFYKKKKENCSNSPKVSLQPCNQNIDSKTCKTRIALLHSVELPPAFTILHKNQPPKPNQRTTSTLSPTGKERNPSQAPVSFLGLLPRVKHA